MTFRKNYFVAVTLAALFFAFSATASFGQITRGKIELKKADGTTAPVSGAVIDVYRTDIKAKSPAGKTDKKGNFSFVGLGLGQTFAFAVSAPGIQPQIVPNIRAGMEDVSITVYEGDGKRFTEDEVRQSLSAPKTNPTAAASGDTAQPAQPAAAPTSEEAKKAKAEYDKQVAEATAKNEKIKNSNTVINAALKDGRAAVAAQNYDLAIAKFDEGINADPDFAGSAPVLLNNKAEALRLRGYNSYKKSTTDAANRETLMASAKKDFTDMAAAYQRALDILKTGTDTDPAVQKNYAANRLAALAGLVEAYRLLIGTRADQTKNKEAVVALNQYVAVETDAAAKTKPEVLLADVLRQSGNSADAVPIYKQVLATAPDNVDAMGGLGLSLFDVGASNTDKAAGREQMQEGLNLMKRFTEVAPETHPLKADIKGAVDYLVNTEKLAPQKVAPGKRKS